MQQINSELSKTFIGFSRKLDDFPGPYWAPKYTAIVLGILQFLVGNLGVSRPKVGTKLM